VSETLHAVCLVAGIVVVVGTLWSVFSTLIVPRSNTSHLLRAVAEVITGVARPMRRRLRTYEARDRLMAIVGPLSMISLFIAWLVLLIIGFGLITFWVSDGTGFGHALAISGSSVFTLGVVSGRRGSTESLEFIAAGCGLLVIAMEIAYLPTLYSAFATRESQVTLLATRGGIPAWGPEILTRSQWFHTMAELPELYASWERWAAEVSESHTNYPSLMWFRSPASDRSWLLGLLAMLDAAALHDATCPGSSPRQARLFLQMGTNCLRSLAGALRLEYDPDPVPLAPIRLTYGEYMEGITRMQSVDFPMERTPDEAWRHFRGWRVNYESIVDQLTEIIMAPVGPWVLERPALGPPPAPRIFDRTPDQPYPDRPAAD
jgi:hypothetical protein